MKDSADPLDGWSLPEILKQNAGPASNDIYGKLHRHVSELLRSFHRSLTSRQCTFRFLHKDANDLAENLQDKLGFDRIEVNHTNHASALTFLSLITMHTQTSNIADEAYLGTAGCLALLGTMLKTPDLNPHATLLTLYMNAVDEMARDESMKDIEAEYKRTEPYIFKANTPAQAPLQRYSKQQILLGASRTLLRDVDKYFDR